jgi:para-nitrobenzyl esterase
MRMAEAHAAHEPRTYAYLFVWESPAMGGALGSCHALELPFVFGALDDPRLKPFTGEGAEAQALSERMQESWLAFARGADPSCLALGRWPLYEGTRRATMLLGPECSVHDAPLEEERRAWDGVL